MALSLYARLTAFATFALIIAGGLVTSTGSGLAVPDWPLSYGMLFPPMVGGILYEHGHRMVAGTVAVLTAVLAVWLWRAERRRWVRRLGALALAAVLMQAVLGGLTVLFLLPTAVSVAHALLAQTFFCITVAIAMATAPGWADVGPRPPDRGRPSLFALGAATTGAIFAQLLLGALMRHTGAALAIPDFPLAFGRLVPPLGDPRVAVHFAHRVWAVVVLGMAAWTIARVLRRHDDDGRLANPAFLLGGLLLVQVLLGASTVWSRRAVPIATAHVAVGALALATSLALTIRAARRLARPHGAAARAEAAAAAWLGADAPVGDAGPDEARA
jgi:cytochrome c oxidase assembly protein subunit 15